MGHLFRIRIRIRIRNKNRYTFRGSWHYACARGEKVKKRDE